MAAPGSHDLSDRPERTDRGFLDPCSYRRPRLQSDRNGDALVSVEQKWRQLAPGIEPVSAVRAHRGMDAVAQLAQPVDVPPHGPTAGPEPGRQKGPWPIPAGLQQRQQI